MLMLMFILIYLYKSSGSSLQAVGRASRSFRSFVELAGIENTANTDVSRLPLGNAAPALLRSHLALRNAAQALLRSHLALVNAAQALLRSH